MVKITVFFKILSICILSMGLHEAIAQEGIPEKFSLKEAQDYAAMNSYDAKSSKLDVDAARRRVKETTAIGLPQISAAGSFQRFFVIPTQVLPDFISPVVLGTLIENQLLPPSAGEGQEESFIPAQFGTDYNISGGVTVNQLLFDGSYIVGLQAAKTYVEIALNNQIKSEIEIRDNVAKAYGAVLVAERNQENLKENIKNIQKITDETKALYENGFAEATDLDQLELSLSNLQNMLNYTKRQIEVSYNLLKFAMGIPIEQKINLSDPLENLTKLANNEAFLDGESNAQAHIDYRMALTNFNAQSLQLKNAKTGYMPQLTAFYNYQRNYLANDFNLLDNEWFPSSILGVNLNVPIFSSFGRKHQVELARIEVDRAELMRDMVEESVKVGAENAKANYRAALDKLDAENKSLELAKRIKNNTFIKYKEGMASSFDLNAAQNQELESQGRQIAAMYELINAKINLDTALGQKNF